MKRGRGRSGGPQQWMPTERPSVQEDHAEPNIYSDNENTSGGKGRGNHNNIEVLDKRTVNGRPNNFGDGRGRGRGYWKGSKDDRVGRTNQCISAQHNSHGSLISDGIADVSASSSGINFPHISDQVPPIVHDMDVSRIQISNSQLNGAEKGSNLMNERNKGVNVSQGATRQPLNPGFIAKPDGKEIHASDKLDTSDVSCIKCPEPSEESESYDICFNKSGTVVTLKPSLLAMNREKRNEMKRAIEGKKGVILRTGLILLKNHLSIPEQARIVSVCRRLGQGPGGFYQPGYREGGKLHLKMMCLGKNWDPESSKYVDVRSVDGAKPPPLPSELTRWVDEAMQESHKLIKETLKSAKVENILPSMSPDLCIVNFYTTSGKLGLHQDRDESEESLKKGLPVVSFSIGDTAEFLYSDQQDADKADKVLLVSGDILIFGGTSRHIFHGVERILPNTAPKSLLAETNLRPGRLNLTFRQE